MHDTVVFNNLGQAQAQQNVDYVQHRAIHAGSTDYLAVTIEWAEIFERLDGQWAYIVHPAQTYPVGFTIEPYDPADYPPATD